MLVLTSLTGNLWEDWAAVSFFERLAGSHITKLFSWLKQKSSIAIGIIANQSFVFFILAPSQFQGLYQAPRLPRWLLPSKPDISSCTIYSEIFRRYQQNGDLVPYGYKIKVLLAREEIPQGHSRSNVQLCYFLSLVERSQQQETCYTHSRVLEVFEPRMNQPDIEVDFTYPLLRTNSAVLAVVSYARKDTRNMAHASVRCYRYKRFVKLSF
jgi:hypothetical protein